MLPRRHRGALRPGGGASPLIHLVVGRAGAPPDVGLAAGLPHHALVPAGWRASTRGASVHATSGRVALLHAQRQPCPTAGGGALHSEQASRQAQAQLWADRPGHTQMVRESARHRLQARSRVALPAVPPSHLGERPVFAPDRVARAPEATMWVDGSYLSACSYSSGTLQAGRDACTKHTQRQDKLSRLLG